MNKLILEYIGLDDWNYDTYKDTNGKIYKDIEAHNDINMYLCTACNISGELIGPIDKYLIVEITNPPIRPTQKERFNYMMLSRLKRDCKYFLGNGNRNVKQLWAGNVKDQITEMKKIYNSFDNDNKPEWLTLDDILEFEKQMQHIKK